MMNNDHENNPATVWATICVDALAAAGLIAVCIAPGSRSTPLTLAFEAHPAIDVFVHLDERSAGFFALGLAVAADRPVALVCTSGTAVANFLPAIIEATMSQLPLLILTADRPPELRHSGANQTIDQVKIYGDQVLWSVDVALPEKDASTVTLRNLQTLMARAYATANGLRKGPVHLNFPFRKPLEPIGDLRLTIDDLQERTRHTATFVAVQRGQLQANEAQIEQLRGIIRENPRGIIVCGPRCPDGEFPAAVAALSQQTGYPIFADPISGLRFGPHTAVAPIIAGYETFLQGDPGWPEPQVVLRFGAVPISKWLNVYLDRVNPTQRIHIRESGVWADDSQRTTLFLQANETATVQALNSQLPLREDRSWATAVAHTETRHWQKITPQLAATDFDGAYVADIVTLIPDNSTLFMGNSLPIRHLDQFGQAQTKTIFAYASRGASGIDGNISTALGLHKGRGGRLIAVLGDITFYHDMNGLLAIKQLKLQNVTIVLLNNNGGGIFQRLPIAQHDPPFTRLFATPHGLDFKPVCEMYGLQLLRPLTRPTFQTALQTALNTPQPTIIEIKTNRQQDNQLRQQLTA